MKATKHILALLLSLAMIFSMIVASGVMTASAIAGGGLPTTYYRAYGVDLSFWNGTVDFAKLKASGCQFVILRIGYEGSSSRTDTLDTKFLTYYNDARAAGMPLGVYFYSLATTYAGAKQDAQWVMNQIESRNMYFEYPIYYDIEDSTYTYQTSLGSAAMEQLALGWCETLEANGYLPGIYGGRGKSVPKYNRPITPRENMIRYLKGENPLWMPDTRRDCATVCPYVMPDSYARAFGGIDWFGIDWTYEPKSNAAMVTPGTRRLSDITAWEEELVFPDLNAIDWEKDVRALYECIMALSRAEQEKMLREVQGDA